jgi:hypothetical protein
MEIEPLHEDLLENQVRSKPKHGHPDDSNDRQKTDNPNLFDLAKLFGQSCAESALQDPLNGMIQLEDQCAGGKYALPQLDVIPELPDEPVGSKAWYAETIGSGVGSIFPFLGVELTTKRLGASESWISLRAKADSLPLAGSVLGLKDSSEYLSHLAKTSLDGGIYGGVLMPVADPNKDFWQQRAKDGLSVSVTFGTQCAISHGVLNSIEKSGWGHMHFHEEKSLTLKSAAFHMGANLLGSSSAGLVGVETMNYLYGLGPASPEVVKNGVASFAVTGLFLDFAHVGEQKLVGHKSESKSAENADGHHPESVVTEDDRHPASVLTEVDHDPAPAQSVIGHNPTVEVTQATNHIDP